MRPEFPKGVMAPVDVTRWRSRTKKETRLEYETEVTDREAMHLAVLHMGYQPTVRIIKTRRTAGLGGCSLCIDEVEGIGGFIEAERMAPDDADAQAIQAELATLIESLGAGTTRISETYDSLVHAAQEISA